ncbi:MAG: hypothetical protein ACT4P6_10390 [Gemmatimonadaceae bacterium]
MKKSIHKPTRIVERSLFAELTEGLIAFADERRGDRKLRTHSLACRSDPASPEWRKRANSRPCG